MKEINFKLLFLSTLIILTSCIGNSIKETDQIGKQVFEILKNLSTSSKADYVGNFLSIEEIRELGKNEKVVTEEKSRNEMTSMLKDDWIGRIVEDHNNIKEKGRKYGINWQEIEYLDFGYKIGNDDGVNLCTGSLYFKFNNKSYQIEVTSMFNGTEFKLVEISNLNERN